MSKRKPPARTVVDEVQALQDRHDALAQALPPPSLSNHRRRRERCIARARDLMMAVALFGGPR